MKNIKKSNIKSYKKIVLQQKPKEYIIRLRKFIKKKIFYQIKNVIN